jgi:hypothetical protein
LGLVTLSFAVSSGLPGHSDPVPGQAGKTVSLHFVFGKVADILQPVKGVVSARRIVLPEFDLGAQHRGLGCHPILHPPGRDEDDVGELVHDL